MSEVLSDSAEETQVVIEKPNDLTDEEISSALLNIPQESFWPQGGVSSSSKDSSEETAKVSLVVSMLVLSGLVGALAYVARKVFSSYVSMKLRIRGPKDYKTAWRKLYANTESDVWSLPYNLRAGSQKTVFPWTESR